MSKCIIDPDHSVAAFAIRHLTVAFVRGQFNKITGTIYFDPKNPSESSVDAEIDVKSLTTGIKKRDEHLLSPDFFDAEKYPKIVFKSRKIDVSGANKGTVKGELTIHGVTREVAFDVEYFGPVKSPFGGEITLGFTAATKVNREDFGITWNQPMENGGMMIANEVQITIDIEADIVQG